MHEDNELFLSLEDLRRIAEDAKENFQRQANQGIRKKDWEQGIGALASIEAIDSFLYTCSLRASRNAAREEQAPIPKRRKPGARVTELPGPVGVVRKRVGGR